MHKAKSIVLVIVVLVLIGTAGFFTYLIANGQDPLVLLSSRAAEDPEDSILSPTPEFASTSPTTSITPTVTLSPTLTPTQDPEMLPETGGGTVYVTATPTPIENLPVAGAGDYLFVMIFAGVLLLSVALLI